MRPLADVLGWIGAFAVLIAYAMVSTGRVRGNTGVYQVLNLAGSLCLIVNTLFYGAYPSTFVNIVWAGIAVYTLERVRRVERA